MTTYRLKFTDYPNLREAVSALLLALLGDSGVTDGSIYLLAVGPDGRERALSYDEANQVDTLRDELGTFAQYLFAWRLAQGSDNFHATFEGRTGLTEAVVTGHFNDWCSLPHADAEAIAARNGITVREGGFQAYLAEMIPG